MEIIIVIALAASVGSLIDITPARSGAYTGVLVLPTITTLVTGLLWVALLWLGMPANSPVMWTLPLCTGALAAVATGYRQHAVRRHRASLRLAELIAG